MREELIKLLEYYNVKADISLNELSTYILNLENELYGMHFKPRRTSK